tara:strand:- start:6579 stop:7685 length:1107 start_codon:yes stop_codon:yes gene_type:complete
MAYPTTTAANWPGSVGGDTNYVDLFKQAYADTIRLKAQTMESRLSDTCTYEELRGDPLNLDSYKPVATTTRDRGQLFGAETNDQNYSETLTERRTVVPEFHEFAELFDPRDEPALLRAIRPDSNYLMNVAAAFARKKDEVIYAALSGSAGVTSAGSASTYNYVQDISVAQGGATAGSSAGTGISAPPAGSIGAAMTDGNYTLMANTVDVGADNSTLSVEDLVKGRQILEQQGAINPGDPVYVAMNPAIARFLLADTSLTSYDFNAIRPLMSGEIANFLGCEFRLSNEIETGITTAMTADDATTLSEIADGSYAYMYTRSSMVFGMAQDMSVRFDELPQRGYSLQAFHSLGLGSVRMDPKKVVRIGTVS